LRETARIVDARAAAVFSAPRQRKILLSLVDEERSLGQLSRLTETPLSLLHHHIRKFLRLGLVRISRAEARAGAPIKYYRATARAFFVPAELMPAEPDARLASQLRDLLVRSLARTIRGAVYTHDGRGPRMHLVRDAAPRMAATEIWLELRLTDADAATLGVDLRALLHRFETRSGKARRRYLIHAAIAPSDR
jgi:DNA-binding transcriptional ArsR family regulator